MAILFDGTVETAAEVAEYVCKQFALGAAGNWLPLGGVQFDRKAVSMCSYFVHRCNWAAAGHDLPLDFGATARDTERDMIAQGLKATMPKRGFAVCFNNGGCQWGHIGIDLGDGLHYAANTCSVKQGGPGYAISTYDVIGRGRISGYYQTLPLRAQQTLKVVDSVTGTPVECQPLMTGQRMTVAALPFLAAVGVSPKSVAGGVIHEDSLRCFVSEIMPFCGGWTNKYELTADGPRLYLVPPTK